jgi:hypothetical protein
MVAGSLGIVAAYLAFVGDRFGQATQLALAAGSLLVFTAGIAAMIWKGASKRMAVLFALVVGCVVISVGTVIMVRVLTP